MSDNNPVHIHLSRVIPGEKWRIIRMLTKVEELSAHVESIEEAVVLEKSRHTIKTQWRIFIDDFPINWIEEDTLLLRDNKISFKALEGDLEEFRGEWTFQDHEEGTLINLDVYLSVGIPVINDFADAHIKDLVTKNFEAILDTLEKRIISTKYQSFKNGRRDKVAGFGLIGHFYNLNHLGRGLRMIKPDYKVPSMEFLGRLFDLSPSFKMYEMKNYKSALDNVTTHGCILLCTFVPDMIQGNLESVYRKVLRACKLAEKYGVGIVTLGGFTSIVAEKFGKRITEEVDVAVTSGNSFAAAVAIEGVEKAAGLLNKNLADLKVTVVGGTGDIGSACARSLAQKVKQVTITGRSMTNLFLLQQELKKYRKAKIDSSRNNEKAVKHADIVIAAANASSSILKIEWFKSGAIVCDLAYPKNLSYKSTRKDIFVFSGGLVSVPTPIETSVMMGLPTPKVCFACSCEAIVLALEHRYENFSFGRGNITTEKMEEILKLGHKHGFVLAPFFWADKIIDDEMIKEIQEAGQYV